MMKKTFRCTLLCSILVILFIQPAISQQDAALVGYWSFDVEDDVVEDMSGNGNDGTITGDVSWVEGKIGSALEFTPGANVEIPDSDTLRDMDAYTIAMWVKLNEFAPAWNHIFEKDGSYAITMNTGGGDFRFTPNSSVVWVETGVAVDEGTWYYLTLRANADSVSFYVDGVKEGETNEPIAYNTNAINIGHSDPYTVDGVIDEVKFWATALTVDEIKVAMAGSAAVSASYQSLLTTWASMKTR